MSCSNINLIRKEIKQILDKKTFNNDEFIKLLKKYNIKYDNKFETETKNNCKKLNLTMAENIISVPDSCINSIKDTCNSLFRSDEDINKCIKQLRPKLSNITQSSTSEIDNKCYFSVMNKILQPINKNNSEFLIALNSLIGNSPDLDCSKLNVSANSSTKISTINDCINNAVSNQKNIISSCGTVNDVIQSNYNKIIQKCITDTTSIETIDQSSKSTIDNSINNKSFDNNSKENVCSVKLKKFYKDYKIMIYITIISLILIIIMIKFY